ncbi:hypothetical protein [Jiangella rhizosphaerae]|uniref:Uncharacterized protein n=1 Tax=Jiangella rhizosphaerae TaxID=2293569 RepID=A0A418KJ41_9ACTN|nr:hypothetical protein [Jiangella rhizosphaerae]RIQ13670.1 hypothetical protein DY240_25575 [Jiangella rhizosphaerae]
MDVARYRAHCPACPWTSRDFSRYTTAENAARAHADEKDHTCHVIDQYGLRVTGSTVRPGDEI